MADSVCEVEGEAIREGREKGEKGRKGGDRIGREGGRGDDRG